MWRQAGRCGKIRRRRSIAILRSSGSIRRSKGRSLPARSTSILRVSRKTALRGLRGNAFFCMETFETWKPRKAEMARSGVFGPSRDAPLCAEHSRHFLCKAGNPQGALGKARAARGAGHARSAQAPASRGANHVLPANARKEVGALVPCRSARSSTRRAAMIHPLTPAHAALLEFLDTAEG